MSRLFQLPEANPAMEGRCQTFVFVDEGHTLGNALRHIMLQYPDVEYCGYTVPHPAERRMNYRVQAKSGLAIDILKRALQDLEKICDHTMEKFEKAYEQHKASQSISDGNKC